MLPVVSLFWMLQALSWQWRWAHSQQTKRMARHMPQGDKGHGQGLAPQRELAKMVYRAVGDRALRARGTGQRVEGRNGGRVKGEEGRKGERVDGRRRLS
jgi:hypothetical protein